MPTRSFTTVTAMGSLSSFLTNKLDFNITYLTMKEQDTKNNILGKLPIGDVVRSVSIEDIKNGNAHIDMRGSEKWGKKVDRLRQILRIAAPKKLRLPAYSFAPFYHCKDGYWYESNWRETGSVPVLDIVD